MNIKKKIKEKGFTLEQLANELKTSQPALSQLINGNPTYQKLKEIADVLGISVSELVSEDEEPHNDFMCPNCGTRFEILRKE